MASAGYQIHKQQLFHWIGQGIQQNNKGNKVLSDALADQAIAHITASIKNGLWVKTPRIPEVFTLQKATFALRRPITCFTEWSLGESIPHTNNYGRIGFGFPKKWAIDRGGQSVTYFRHASDCGFLKTIFKLLKSAGDPVGNGEWTPKPGQRLDELIYLFHFAKMIRASAARSPKKKAKAPPSLTPGKTLALGTAPPKKVSKPPTPTFRRKFGAELEFVEEREWRIVHYPNGKHFVTGPGTPEFFLPYIPGDELFTLVVPDHKVVTKLLASTWLTDRLFTPHKIYKELKGKPVPPVTLLAHSDLGTF
jgi:hypothetical protein